MSDVPLFVELSLEVEEKIMVGLQAPSPTFDVFLRAGPLVANFSSLIKSVLALCDEFIVVLTGAGVKVLLLDCIISAVNTAVGL